MRLASEICSRFVRRNQSRCRRCTRRSKKDGKRLYELARKGETVEREPRPVRIHEIQLLEAAVTACEASALLERHLHPDAG